MAERVGGHVGGGRGWGEENKKMKVTLERHMTQGRDLLAEMQIRARDEPVLAPKASTLEEALSKLN